MSTASTAMPIKDLSKERPGATVEGGEEASDRQLAAKAANGCLSSMENLFQTYHTKIYRFLFAKTQIREEAEDLTQDTFLTACRKIHQYNPRYAFSTWLFTIAQRQATSAWRKKRPTTSEFPDLQDISSTPEQQAQASEDKENIWKTAREILNTNQYSAIWLHYVEDMPVAEIAKTLNKTTPGVKLLLFRARKKLQTSFTSQPLKA